MKLAILPLVVFALLAETSDAALVAYWNFNGLSIASPAAPGTGDVPASIAADMGSGTVGLAGWNGTVDDFGGSTVNAISPDGAGVSLSLITTAGNGSFITLSFPMIGRENPILSFATQGTASGYTSNQVAYSTDGVSYTDFGVPYVPAGSFALQTFDFSSIDALDGDSSVFLKITFTGATSGSGNNRIDNLQINAVPEPSAALVTAFGLLGLLRRRRD